ncbi:hypothetical protein C8Q78DRAFT_411724 [Trametes maxima]|nr:hypothetical protein C8Q78DRAFT_411724 [Trametes maxima]
MITEISSFSRSHTFASTSTPFEPSSGSATLSISTDNGVSAPFISGGEAHNTSSVSTSVIIAVSASIGGVVLAAALGTLFCLQRTRSRVREACGRNTSRTREDRECGHCVVVAIQDLAETTETRPQMSAHRTSSAPSQNTSRIQDFPSSESRRSSIHDLITDTQAATIASRNSVAASLNQDPFKTPVSSPLLVAPQEFRAPRLSIRFLSLGRPRAPLYLLPTGPPLRPLDEGHA